MGRRAGHRRQVLRVSGDKACLLVGVDHPSHDVVHALVLPHEDGVGFERLVREAVVQAGYPLQGLVSDLGGGFLEAWRDHFPRVPWQACRIHFDRHLDGYVPSSSAIDARRRCMPSSRRGCARCFKRFTDSRRNGGNGKSPLEHAGAHLPTHDWLDYLLTTHQQQPI